ncbi:MAG TPA: LysR family transcriptional regulator, partial [Anaerolineales bacterium]|nr:LysR family transcriptional regulator [Anaerolineales bacterium]
MDTKILARIDLNLLVALQVLIEEQSVTRAAERLYITQPAMSKTLQRLRELFDDPLFIRSGRGLIPTPRTAE